MRYNARQAFAMTAAAGPRARAAPEGCPWALIPRGLKPSRPSQEVPDRARKCGGLLHIGKVPGARELEQLGTRHRFRDLPDTGDGRILGADDQQGAAVDAGKPG